jgi:hypothetical protein
MGTDQRSLLPGLDHRQNRPSEEHKLRQIAFLRMHRASPDAIIWAGQTAKGAHHDRTVEDRVRFRSVRGQGSRSLGTLLRGRRRMDGIPARLATTRSQPHDRQAADRRVPRAGLYGQLRFTVADEVVTADRVAFSVECVFPDGKRIFEHVVAHIEDGKIVRLVDVEAWD